MTQEYIYTKFDIVYKYICESPREIITPKELTEKLGLKYNTVNSAINRLYISGKIKKVDRGKYTLYLPLPEGQTTLFTAENDNMGDIGDA
jgi:Sugar-specific transcriptional regulator TrmB.